MYAIHINPIKKLKISKKKIFLIIFSFTVIFITLFSIIKLKNKKQNFTKIKYEDIKKEINANKNLNLININKFISENKNTYILIFTKFLPMSWQKS